MPWRWGWPPWESERAAADRRKALGEVERATIDLAVTREKVLRTGHVHEGIAHAHARNHFSESMEVLFEQRVKNKGAP
jgi:hypothetical protein